MASLNDSFLVEKFSQCSNLSYKKVAIVSFGVKNARFGVKKMPRLPDRFVKRKFFPRIREFLLTDFGEAARNLFFFLADK